MFPSFSSDTGVSFYIRSREKRLVEERRFSFRRSHSSWWSCFQVKFNPQNLHHRDVASDEGDVSVELQDPIRRPLLHDIKISSL